MSVQRQATPIFAHGQSISTSRRVHTHGRDCERYFFVGPAGRRYGFGGGVNVLPVDVACAVAEIGLGGVAGRALGGGVDGPFAGAEGRSAAGSGYSITEGAAVGGAGGGGGSVGGVGSVDCGRDGGGGKPSGRCVLGDVDVLVALSSVVPAIMRTTVPTPTHTPRSTRQIIAARLSDGPRALVPVRVGARGRMASPGE